jgi:hypothetical protein
MRMTERALLALAGTVASATLLLATPAHAWEPCENAPVAIVEKDTVDADTNGSDYWRRTPEVTAVKVYARNGSLFVSSWDAGCDHWTGCDLFLKAGEVGTCYLYHDYPETIEVRAANSPGAVIDYVLVTLRTVTPLPV